jgi:SAM-dependent methyltransferase
LQACRARGVKAIESDIFAHLDGLQDACLGGIFCSHLLEHLVPNDALRLLRECYRVLRPSGSLVLVTPNSLDLRVIMQTFWLDLTHVRLYPGALLQPLLKEIGFAFAEYYDDKYTRYGGRWQQRILDFARRCWLWGLANRGDLIVAARK